MEQATAASPFNPSLIDYHFGGRRIGSFDPASAG
jgi:hypothetical protein